MIAPPEGFERLSGIGARGFVRPEAAEWARAALTRWGNLERAGLHHTEALELRGRGTLRAVPAPTGGRWVIRRYHRGGAMGPILGDRYLRRGTPRPWVEARASEAARRRGVPTPRVVAGVVYPAGIFYRAELMTEYVPDSVDLAGLLFADEAPEGFDDPRLRPVALREAGALVVELARAGILHRDLNAKNLLVHRDANGRPTMAVLDLDRARVRPVDSVDPLGMTTRLDRSLRKLEQASGRTLGELEWASLAQGLATEAEA